MRRSLPPGHVPSADQQRGKRSTGTEGRPGPRGQRAVHCLSKNSNPAEPQCVAKVQRPGSRSGRRRCKSQGRLVDSMSPFRRRAAPRMSWLRFRKIWSSTLLWESDGCESACKRREICSIEKSDVLCFQALLSFVPTIFVFSRSSLDCPDRAISTLDLFPVRGLRQSLGGVGILDFSAECGHFSTQLRLIWSSF